MLHMPLYVATRRSTRSQAFSLIELLVVIAIVAILVAVLLPALGRARLAARIAATLSNLRDLSVGVNAYANDFRGVPPVRHDPEEKAVLGLAVLAKYNDVPTEAFINPATTDDPSKSQDGAGRPVLVELFGQEIRPETEVGPQNISSVSWHCSFAYDNDPKRDHSTRARVFLGDRADYSTGETVSAAWHGLGQCLVWTDGHALFWKTRSIADQRDPNIYHHNEFGDHGEGEGASESRDGVSTAADTLDTHLRFFSEEEDDQLLPN